MTVSYGRLGWLRLLNKKGSLEMRGPLFCQISMSIFAIEVLFALHKALILSTISFISHTTKFFSKIEK